MSKSIGILQGNSASPAYSIKDALKLYFSDRPDRRQRTRRDRQKFERERERIIEDLIKNLGGNRFVADVSRADARRYLDKVKACYAPASANKMLHFLSTLFKGALREQESDKANPWEALRVPDPEPDKDKRHPFSMEQAKVVLGQLSSVNTDLRRIGVITTFTGARLAEICGLDAADVSLGEISSINMRPNAHRILKTKSSIRVVPLVGPALDAVKVACEDHRSGPLFPRYAKPGGPDAASASLMKMLRTKAKIEDEKLTWHSWRHTMKDLMRNAGIDRELQDRIFGHAGTGVSFNYGKGPDISILRDLMETALAPLVQIVDDGIGSSR